MHREPTQLNAMENLDIDFGPQHHTRQQVLQKYNTALKYLRSYAERTYQLNPYAFDNYIIFHYFQQRSINQTLNTTTETTSTTVMGISEEESWAAFLKFELLNHILDRRRQIMYWLFYLLLALLCVFVYRYETSTLITERSMQSILYPGMRMWRRMTLPLIQRFPRLTELYDESCLMGNPFFQVDNMSCRLCAQVEAILDLSDSNSSHVNTNRFTIGKEQQQGQLSISEHVPFTFKNNHTPIALVDFYKIYIKNREIFQRDAFRVQSTDPKVKNLDEFFNQINHTQHTQSHVLWRCNRMLPARLLRKLITRPPLLPNSLALERFVAVDSPHAPSYALPDTECRHAYIQQTLGARFIILRPTSECRHRCRTLSMRLPQSYVLSYNWWYWKPISAPDPVTDTLSISLIGSYC